MSTTTHTVEEITQQIQGLFFIEDNISFTIKDKTKGQFPNFETDKLTLQLFDIDGNLYINPITSKLLKVNTNICIYIPYADTVLTFKIKHPYTDINLLHGEEVEIESYNIYQGID